jgi:hypothetical protein
MVVAGLLGWTILPMGATVLADGRSKSCAEKLVGKTFTSRIPHIKVVLVVLPCVNVPLEIVMSDAAMMVWEAPHG